MQKQNVTHNDKKGEGLLQMKNIRIKNIILCNITNDELKFSFKCFSFLAGKTPLGSNQASQRVGRRFQRWRMW